MKLLLVLLIVALVITVILSLNVDTRRFLRQHSCHNEQKIPFLSGAVDPSLVLPMESAIILQIRLPRIIAGSGSGAALASIRVVYQGVFKNPMADSMSSGYQPAQLSVLLSRYSSDWAQSFSVSVSRRYRIPWRRLRHVSSLQHLSSGFEGSRYDATAMRDSGQLLPLRSRRAYGSNRRR